MLAETTVTYVPRLSVTHVPGLYRLRRPPEGSPARSAVQRRETSSAGDQRRFTTTKLLERKVSEVTGTPSARVNFQAFPKRPASTSPVQ